MYCENGTLWVVQLDLQPHRHKIKSNAEGLAVRYQKFGRRRDKNKKSPQRVSDSVVEYGRLTTDDVLKGVRRRSLWA